LSRCEIGMRMKVVIVAKTKMGGGACVGGITLDEGRSVWLFDTHVSPHNRGGTHYNIGEVWEIDAVFPERIELPHTEDIYVRSGRCVGRMDHLLKFIERVMQPAVGEVDSLFEGKLQHAAGGALFVAASSGLPSFSTCFWRPDRPLQRVETNQRIRYVYPSKRGNVTFVFIGFQEPLPEIPAGTLVQISLSRPWRPSNSSNEEARCYAQISGWFNDTDRYAMQPLKEGNSSARTLSANLTQARLILKKVFGYDEFRPLQEEIIASVLSGQDTLAIMPTGSGKSICYQIPALLFERPTVVVSPLIALMQDQVEQLRQLGISAAYLNSTLDYQAYSAVIAEMRAGKVKLLYVAPETLLRPETLRLLETIRPACLAIDEAHCISEWGHDFRPEYRQLLDVRRRFPEAVCIAVTATAPPYVQQDIKQILHFSDSQTFIASYNRPNLFLSVRPRQDGFRQLLNFLENYPEESGIIYCSTRRQVDELVKYLCQKDLRAVAYHAGLENSERAANQRRFLIEDGCIAVATIAFGMGINKPDVRFVVHYNLPASIEHYYQQIGRAGRDGLPAHCLLLYHPKDLETHYFHIEQGASTERAGRIARLQAIDRFARTRGCRRIPLLNYFGEQISIEECEACDNCLKGSSDFPVSDVTIEAQKFLSCVKRTGEQFGISYIVDVLRGSQRRQITARRHDQLSTYGIGKEHSAQTWRHLAQEFILQGLLDQNFRHGGVRLTDTGWAVLRKELNVTVPAEVVTSQFVPVKQKVASHNDEDLFHRLRALRRKLADELNVPAFFIFHDRTLVEMAMRMPQTLEELRSVYGVGEHKLQQFGKQFVACIRAYCQEKGIDPSSFTQEDMERLFGSLPKRRFETVGELFNNGHRIAEIQALFGVKRETILRHLERYHQAGRPLDPQRLLKESELPPELLRKLLHQLKGADLTFLEPIYNELDGLVSYDELRLLRLYLACLYTSENPSPPENPSPIGKLLTFVRKVFSV
jgi:ATP-dependent DNA helicase RecQ